MLLNSLRIFTEKTIFVDKEKLSSFLENYKISSNKKLEKDPLFKLSTNLFQLFFNKIIPSVQLAEEKMVRIDRLWMQAIMQFEKDKVLYPDANFTLRVTYGKVDDYFPYDGIKYLHYTTLKGIMEKDNPDIYDYKVPEKTEGIVQKQRLW
jgi:hypothetical protein